MKWIALMSTGTDAPSFRIEAPEGLTLPRTEGAISVEERVVVAPDAAFSQDVLRIVTEDAVHEIEVVRSAVDLYTRPGVLDTCVDLPDISEKTGQVFFPFRPDDVPPKLVVADDDFWTRDMLYARNRRLSIAG